MRNQQETRDLVAFMRSWNGIKTGGLMAKSKKTGKRAQPKKKTSKRRRKSDNISRQTNQPFEQDPKRRIGQFEGEGEPPLMKK
jgi:hypothetical protein